MDAPTITIVKDGGFFGHPQSDMGNVGSQPFSQRRLTTTRGYCIGCLTTRTLNGPANGNRRYRTTWQRRMRFRGLKFDSDTSGAAVVSAFARSGVARRNQEI